MFIPSKPIATTPFLDHLTSDLSELYFLLAITPSPFFLFFKVSFPLEANPLDGTVVASKCANVVAGAGSIKSSAGT